MVYRILSYRNVYNRYISCFYKESTLLKNNYFDSYYCVYCQNKWKNHLAQDYQVRLQSTHAALVRKLTKKKGKSKNPRKYVELLEVNDKVTTETQASVSKLNVRDISKLIANNELSLNQFHKLKTTKKKKKEELTVGNVDIDLHREIENSLLNLNNDKKESYEIKEDDSAIIFTSYKVSNIKLLQSHDGIKSIKDSYDKFRRETVRQQKMKDIILAINEGLDQYESSTHKSINSHLPEYIKPRQEKLKDVLSELDNYDNLFNDLEERGVHFPAAIDFIDDVSENVLPDVKSDTAPQKSEDLNASEKIRKGKKKKVAKNSNMQAEDYILKGKEFSLNKLLLCHLDVCVQTGNLNKGFQLFKYFRRRGQNTSNNPKIQNIDIINVLLRGYAAKGDYDTIVNILDMVATDGINMDHKSYAAVFECIDRWKNIDNKRELLLKHREDMINKGLNLNDMVTKVYNSPSQRKHILSAISIIEPSFAPHFEPEFTGYECDLVNELNSTPVKSIRYTSPADGLFTHQQLHQQAAIQMENEEKGIVHISNIMDKGCPSESVLYYRKKYNEWEEETRKILHKAFTKNMTTLKAQSNASSNPLNIVPYLSLLTIDKYVDILMMHIKKIATNSEHFSLSVRHLQKDLGQHVNMVYKLQRKKADGVSNKILQIYQQYCEWYLNRESQVCHEKLNSRKAWNEIIINNRDDVSLNIDIPSWPTSVCVCVGKFLHSIMLNDVHIDVNVLNRNAKHRNFLPALYSVYRSHGYIRKSELKPHPILVKLILESACSTFDMDTTLVPSLCPPLPWTTPTCGGYLLSELPVIRIMLGSYQQLKLLETSPPHKLYPVLDSLNQLGSIPWRVNEPILDLMISIFRNGGSEQLNIACSSSSLPPLPPVKKSLTKKEKGIAHRLRAQFSKQKQEMHSLWCDLLYKLSLANQYRKTIFWLPHNMDFRGRTYPCPPHLSHLGSDISRAVMMFAKGQPLGEKGLQWLKLHCVNLTGKMKKCTIDERLSYAEQFLDKILDSADNPLDGERWWLDSDDPWQTLACCKEIANALRSPNHEEYISHIPVHQDGSCNGLQHYAALGRDQAGAYSVNLSAADKPQDVYSAVVNLVESSRACDAANGVKVAQVLEGFIQRKVIKQTIMTTVYGVTRFGARLQIAKQLKDIDNFPREHVWGASLYLANKTFESLSEMFTSTKQIQDWFTECARVISTNHNDKVQWVTPLGLPIIQPYYKTKKVSFNSKDTLMEYAVYDEAEYPCKLKQRNAFPPNFIHSLDASHMMLTSLQCEAQNITFVSVHDCFWSHASSVEVMNKICREQFVALHSYPILEDLSKYLYDKYYTKSLEENGQNKSYTAILDLVQCLPERGHFDLQNVLKSKYFFS